MPNLVGALIETNELAGLIEQGAVKVLDASYHVPPSPRDASEEFKAQHIPGAQFFDIDAISDPSSPYPHMLPSAERFAQVMGSLGLSNQDTVVVYDVHGIMSAPRAWWMLRYFGHDNVFVLNGGLVKWLKENRPVESDIKPSLPATFEVTIRPELLLNVDQVAANLDSKQYQLLDCRPHPRFLGELPEPRAGLRLGHIPNSLNMPWASLVDPDTKCLVPKGLLEEKLAEMGIETGTLSACSCGSGVTACVGALALYTLGHQQVPVYDGSWAEWGSREDLPLTEAVTPNAV